MSPRSESPAAAVTAQSKRRWNERDWDVVFPAQTYIAVYADASATVSPQTNSTPVPETTKKPSKKRKTQSRRATKKKDLRSDAVTDPTPATTTATTKTATTDPVLFWLAQLQDDVTENMLDTDAVVRVTWLNRVPGEHEQQYEFAYDDHIDVQTILCHVYVTELRRCGPLELTAKSAARVEKSLRRTRGEMTAEEDAEASEGESAPYVSKHWTHRDDNDDDDDDGDEGTKRTQKQRVSRGRGSAGIRRVLRANVPKKMSKRIAAMHIPPHYAHINEAAYEDRELLGTHEFDACSGDLLSSNREVMRAVRTQNYELLKALIEDPPTRQQLYSFHAFQSPDVKMTALHYAIQADDVKAVTMMQQAHKIAASAMARTPKVSLPSHSTGSHTSAYSDYNRRAINASRGGREGNNALLEDCGNICSGTETDVLWSHPHSSNKLMTVLYPAGEWVNDYKNPQHVASVARAGNLALASKMVEVLDKNGGWGYNDLHVAALSTTDQPVPTFRSVSVFKKAQTTKITPLHFAAINPNVKYLVALWENGGSEQSSICDDAQFEPIHYAAANASPCAVRFLLAHKANLLARTKAKHTPLMRALITRREATAIAMLEHVASEPSEFANQVLTSRGPESYQLLHFAAENNCITVLKHLLTMGVDVNALAAGQTTALSLAARRGHFECVEMLLEHGAKIDRADKLKKTPLLLAVKNGHTRLAAFLINKGANVNAYDSSENSVVHYAASYGWMSCLQLLNDAGADLWSRNSWGFVPLICAMLKQRTVCADFILKRDNEQRFLDFRDRSGRTMLFLQCQHSTDVTQIVYLLEKGLDPNIGDCDDERPLDVLIGRAASARMEDDASFFVDAIRALVAHGAVVNYSSVNEDGTTHYPRQPLQIAIKNNSRDIFDFLLRDGGADASIIETYGTDAWLTSASLGSQGSYYLEKLLEKYPTPRAMPLATHGGNIFHLIAANAPSKLISVSLVERLMSYCLNAAELMHQKNGAGVTPLMALYEAHQSPARRCAGGESDVVQRTQAFCQIARLFADQVTDVEALKKYTTIRKAIDTESQSTDPDNMVTVNVLESTILHSATRTSSASAFGSTAFGSTSISFGSSFGSRSTAAPSTSQAQFIQAWQSVNLAKLLLDSCPVSKTIVNVAARDGHQTPLQMSVESNDVTSARFLLSAGADPDCSSLRCNLCHVEKNTQCADCAFRGLVDTALIRAVHLQQIWMMKLLLESGASADCFASTSLDTPLHKAMTAGKVDHVRLLLAHGASMVKLNAAKRTPLAAAIAAGLSVKKTKPHEGEIMFTTASLGRNFKPPSFAVLQSSVTAPMSMFGSAPASSVSDPKLRTDSTVIEVALACVEATPAILAADENGRTALHHAARKRDLPLLRALLQRVGSRTEDKAAYVNQPDTFGRTALHFAINSVSMKPNAAFDVERFLFLSGANSSAVDNFGLSPLHFALRKIDLDWHLRYDAKVGPDVVREQKAGSVYETEKAAAFKSHLNGTASTAADPVETISNLIAAGCEPLAMDGLGRSALHLAASAGAFVCVSTLLSACPHAHRAKFLEQQDVDGFSPLGRAFKYARETTITTLIQSGARVSGAVTIDGQARSNFSVAVEKSMSGICHMLLNAGFSRRQAVEDAVCGNQLELAKNLMVGLEISNDRGLLIESNERGETLLHCLAKSIGSTFSDLATELAWTLVDGGIDVTAQDHDGNTALHHASVTKNTRLMDFLFHHGCDVNTRNKAGATAFMHALVKQHGVGRVATVQYMLLHKALDLRACDSDGFDGLALFIKYFLDEFENDEALHLWFELALERHGDVNTMYAAMTSTTDDLLVNAKLGKSSTAVAPLLVWVTYSKSVATRCQLLRALLQHGASPTATDTNGNSALHHLVARNLYTEASLFLQESAVSISGAVLDTANHGGQTALHLAVEPLAYGSYENVRMIELLVKNGASLDVKDANGATPLDYATRQTSRFVFRFLKNRFPTLVRVSEEAAFDDAMDVDNWRDAPDFGADADMYLNACEASGKIVKTRVAPQVNHNCDVGTVNSVFGLLDATGNVVEGEEYDALLTKVDVKHGKHGINVFYRMQVVHDELQNLYVVFTNWGRVGEDGKFQNTPFHAAAEAVAEFRKIFKSKTGNAWEGRRDFVKRAGKYNLVQRDDYETEIEWDVTRSFIEHMQHLKAKKVDVLTAFAPLDREDMNDSKVVTALLAITDVRHLQLAARDCEYYNDLPLAHDHELRKAMTMLSEIRAVVTKQADVKNEMNVVSSNLVADDASARLAELSDNYAALMEDLSERSSRYYEVVPRNEDRRGSAIGAFESIASVDKELYRLKRLLDITHTYKMLLGAKLHQKQIHPMEYVLDSMQIRMARLPTESNEHRMLVKYFSNGIRPRDRLRYQISNIFEVTRRGEAERLQACLQSDAVLSKHHTTLLWHGTNRTNLMGILSEGLRIAPPEASHNGYAYGKGIYFSDVAAKSLHYCQSPYAIDQDVEAVQGKTKTKTRHVHYMLLCEVALGDQRPVRSSSMYNREALANDGFHSVRAVGQHAPNPTESLVSPLTGAKVPLGQVGRLGRDFERASAWAVRTVASSNNATYSFQSFQLEAETYLDRSLASRSSWKVGDVIPITKSTTKALFVRTTWNSHRLEDMQVEIRVTEINQVPGTWDIGVDFVVTPLPRNESNDTASSSAANGTQPAIVVGKARRYQNVNFTKLPKLDKDFSMPELSTGGQYNEHIVYATEQARVRYLVEVELA